MRICDMNISIYNTSFDNLADRIRSKISSILSIDHIMFLSIELYYQEIIRSKKFIWSDFLFKDFVEDFPLRISVFSILRKLCQHNHIFKISNKGARLLIVFKISIEAVAERWKSIPKQFRKFKEKDLQWSPSSF